MERDLRRLRLLVTRAVVDCGPWHPEIRELDTMLRLERLDEESLRPLVAIFERPRPAHPDRSDCLIIRHNIAAELRELLAADRATAV